jgi:hypothetical protein
VSLFSPPIELSSSVPPYREKLNKKQKIKEDRLAWKEVGRFDEMFLVSFCFSLSFFLQRAKQMAKESMSRIEKQNLKEQAEREALRLEQEERQVLINKMLQKSGLLDCAFCCY